MIVCFKYDLNGNDNLLGEVPQLAAGGAYALAYDADGRLTADESRGVTLVEMDHGGTGGWVTLAEHTYDELGRTASTAMLGGTTATAYGYNIRGWVSAVANPHFSQTLHYNTTGGQPYKYGGKELERQHGLNQYDFGARWYDPARPGTTTMDPLCERRPWESPYLWCAGNPVKFIDPDGLNPVYNQSGTYLGNTTEGFTGQVLIYTGSTDFDVSKYSSDQIINLDDNITLTMDELQSSNPLEGEALSAIWTNIVSHYEGEMIFDERFSIKTLEGEKIQYEPLDHEHQVNFSTYPYHTKPTKIVGNGTNYTSYESTVENLAGSLLYHEWYGHGRKFYSNRTRTHHKAYEAVMNSPLWEKTTERFKLAILKKYKLYLEKRL